jgi:manganese/zinc/iron transport system permease protein
MEWTSFDSWIVATGMLSAMACALLGNYLVLRRMSMMGDAISHAVLPGLAIAFIVTGSRGSLPMLVGATLIGIVTAFLIQAIFRLSGLDKGASMGVIFTTLFALGLILIRQAADHVDLDPSCVLYGAIELTPLDTYDWGGWEIPRAAVTNGVMLLFNLAFVLGFYKELKITSFDPALATTIGINADVLHYVLMTLVAATTIAAFESVGSILVIAMLIVPGRPPIC